MSNNPDILSADIETVRQVRRCIQEVLSVPAGALEHVIQVAHESTARQKEDPPEVFAKEGMGNAALRMFWHFRCNIGAFMPPEDRG